MSRIGICIFDKKYIIYRIIDDYLKETDILYTNFLLLEFDLLFQFPMWLKSIVLNAPVKLSVIFYVFCILYTHSVFCILCFVFCFLFVFCVLYFTTSCWQQFVTDLGADVWSLRLWAQGLVKILKLKFSKILKLELVQHFVADVL